MNNLLTFVAQLPALVLAGYLVMALVLLSAIKFTFETLLVRAAIRRAQASLERRLDPVWGNRRHLIHALAGSPSHHPAVPVLKQVFHEPVLARDDAALSAWIALSLHDLLRLRSHLERIKMCAPLLAFTATTLGFVAGTLVYSAGHDQGELMMCVGSALIGTSCGGLSALLASWALGALNPLINEIALHTQGLAVRARHTALTAPETANASASTRSGPPTRPLAQMQRINLPDADEKNRRP